MHISEVSIEIKETGIVLIKKTQYHIANITEIYIISIDPPDVLIKI